MRSSWLRSRAPMCFTLVLIFLATVGCQPVREDRSINFSHDGKAVGFQHGGEGVFVADEKGGKLTRIYQPDADVLATSTPLWSPRGRRAVFTTARSVGGQTTTMRFSFGRRDDPAGNMHPQQAVIYTCWMYEESPDGQAGKPVELFQAACDHVGYVAANLAVRWHPREDRILFIQHDQTTHRLWEYDLATKQSKQVFPHASDALLFDWTPDGSHLVCALGNHSANPFMDGIWIGRPEGEDWWHVPDSGQLAQSEVSSLIENLRATRPAWTKDGARFAFSSFQPGTKKDEPPYHFLRLGVLATRQTRFLAAGKESYRDLHWRPDGKQLGVIRGAEDAGSLVFLRPGEEGQPVGQRGPVHRFAGWNADNNRWAYTVPDVVPPAEKDFWALLFVPDPQGRDAVWVGGANEAEQEVLTGMRVTFPQWSPRADKLSLWVTFTPPYRSWPSLFLGWGLRPGDPAAIFDVPTRQLSWMAVNGHEKVQVGHYFLLKRDYATAWHWYEEAERELPPPQPGTGSEFIANLAQPMGTRDFSFFQYYCLTKLKRPAEARIKQDQFRRVFLPKPAEKPTAPDPLWGTFLSELLDSEGLWASLLRDFYMAEVFLSLNAAADAEVFFRESLTKGKEPERLAAALVLSQILLLEKKHSAYAELATKTLAPSLFQINRPKEIDKTGFSPDGLIDVVGGFALVPLFVPEFLTGLPAEQVQALLKPWQALRDKAGNDSNRHQADLALHAAFGHLGKEKERDEVAQRLQVTSPALAPWMSGMDIRKLRKEILEFVSRR